MPSNDSRLSSCVRWPAGPTARPLMPALLNAQSSRPKAATVRATIAATSASRLTSPPMAIAWPPAALISPTVPAALSSVRSATATRAPSRLMATAVARPIPDAPPVTSAVLPSRMPAMVRFPFSCVWKRQAYRRRAGSPIASAATRYAAAARRGCHGGHGSSCFCSLRTNPVRPVRRSRRSRSAFRIAFTSANASSTERLMTM